MKSKTSKKKQTKQQKPEVDVTKLVDKAADDKAAKRAERKAKRAARKAAKNATSRTFETHHAGHGHGYGRTFKANNEQGLTLKDAKRYAKEESSAQPKRVLYVNVDENGGFDYSLRYDPKASLHCFRNGSEVAMITKTITEPINSTTMATAKKTAGKTAKIEGTKKSLSIKEIISMLKKGVRVINKKGRLCNMKKLAKRADQTMKREVWIQKAA